MPTVSLKIGDEVAVELSHGETAIFKINDQQFRDMKAWYSAEFIRIEHRDTYQGPG